MKKLIFLFAFCCGLFAHAQSTADNNRTPIRESVPATAEQLLGKWNISKILNPKQVEFPADKIQGSHFTFNSDKTYTAMVMGAEEKGTWEFGPANRNVYLFMKGMKTIWNILSISDTELVMQKGVRGNTVTFIR